MADRIAPQTLRLRLGGKPVELELPVPAEAVAPQAMMPVFQMLADTLVSAATSAAEQAGHCVSCRLKCAACCRQLVPLAAAEVPWIRELVDRMPEPRRSQVQARFAEALRRLEAAGLLDDLQGLRSLADEDLLALANAYVSQDIACPFLEDESCSIYAERPLACREYLVTSPAENCFGAGPRQIDRVPLPVSVSSVLPRLGSDDQQGGRATTPLVLALQTSAGAPAPQLRPGAELLGELLARLTGTWKPPGTAT